jgi:hypothetical protein
MNTDIGFRYCQSMDGGFAAWTHDEETLFLVQGETIPQLETALADALSLVVPMGLAKQAPKLVHLSRSDSGGSISLAGNRGEELLAPFIQSASQRFEGGAFLGIRKVTGKLHVVAPKGVLKPELVSHLVHALREQHDSRVDPPWEAFLQKWLSHAAPVG